jgi:hypothetical protein
MVMDVEELEDQREMSSLSIKCRLFQHRVATDPSPLRVAKAGRNHLNEEITPLLPTGIGDIAKPYQI